MIRPASRHDRDRAIALLADSHVAAGFDSGGGPGGFRFDFCRDAAGVLFDQHIYAMPACCMVLDVAGEAQGVLMAMAGRHPFSSLSAPVWLARETVWWIDPRHRGRSAIAMLDAYEAWAGSRGCAFAGMAGMGDDPDVAKLYLRRGYVAAERHYLKAL